MVINSSTRSGAKFAALLAALAMSATIALTGCGEDVGNPDSKLTEAEATALASARDANTIADFAREMRTGSMAIW